MVDGLKRMMKSRQGRARPRSGRARKAGAKRRPIMRLVDAKNWLMAFINKNKPIFGLLEGDKNSLWSINRDNNPCLIENGKNH